MYRYYYNIVIIILYIFLQELLDLTLVEFLTHCMDKILHSVPASSDPDNMAVHSVHSSSLAEGGPQLPALELVPHAS